MSQEYPYEPLGVVARGGARALPEAEWPTPDLRFARPLGAWVIVGSLFVVVIALWAMVAVFFSMHS